MDSFHPRISAFWMASTEVCCAYRFSSFSLLQYIRADTRSPGLPFHSSIPLTYLLFRVRICQRSWQKRTVSLAKCCLPDTTLTFQLRISHHPDRCSLIQSKCSTPWPSPSQPHQCVPHHSSIRVPIAAPNHRSALGRAHSGCCQRSLTRCRPPSTPTVRCIGRTPLFRTRHIRCPRRAPHTASLRPLLAPANPD